MSAAGASATVALVLVLCYVPGWAVARATSAPLDLFARIWIGITIGSVAGLVLGEVGRFSLVTLLAAVAGTSALCVVLGRRPRAETRRAAHPAADRSVQVLAAVAAFATVLWSWPPYETVIAASDSTMYVNAGVHLARAGSFSVPETVVPLLPAGSAEGIFPSVGWHGVGPFIRLPGGLLMRTLADAIATPAFFPLLPVWTAILSTMGGATASLLAAPLFAALAVWAVVLFAGETMGLATAAATAGVLIANFAFWWFAKFAMPEPLAAAAIWSGLVFLQRAATDRDVRLALLAGAVFGIAGLARTETFLFLGAAGVLTWAWTRMRVPLLPLIAGLVPLVGIAAFIAARSPSHHLAYLRNDMGLHYLAILPWLTAARESGRLWAATAVLALLLLAAAVAGHRSGIGLVRGTLRLLAPLALVVGVVVYVRIGGLIFPWRALSWLAAYCSWPLLALAVLGAPVVWRRGGEALRVAVFVWLLEVIVFGLNPRISPYQPWAIRRFLPIVVPGIAIAGSAALTWLGASSRRGAAALAIALMAVVVGLEVRAIIPARGQPYYEGNLAAVAAIADRLPEHAIVAIDRELADVQLQVPLWLATGRETLMLREGGQRWRGIMRGLVASGRPVIWIGLRYGSRGDLSGVVLQPQEPDLDLAIVVPDAPADTTPSHSVTRFLPLRIYGVGEGVALKSAGSTSFIRAQSSSVTTLTKKLTWESSPFASLPSTKGWYAPSST